MAFTSISSQYFPNLHGCRFVAAFLVLVVHIEQFKSHFHINNLFDENGILSVIAKLAVVFFFVLSGFLITYRLLDEKMTTGGIDTRRFLRNRILRIWPLYYLVFLSALFLLPHITLFEIPEIQNNYNVNKTYALSFYIFLLPNLNNLLIGHISYASHLWSIGIEEQFYLLIILLFRSKKTIQLLFIFLLAHSFFGLLIDIDGLPKKIDFAIIKNFWFHFNIQCCLIGATFAYLTYTKPSFKNYIVKDKMFFISLLSIIILLLIVGKLPIFHYEVFAILFAILIVNFAFNTTLSIVLESSLLIKLGKASYSMYMLHPIIIISVIKLLSHYNLNNGILISLLCIILTLFISRISFLYFESYFLKYKK